MKIPGSRNLESKLFWWQYENLLKAKVHAYKILKYVKKFRYTEKLN